MTPIAAPEALAGYSLAVGAAFGVVGCVVLYERSGDPATMVVARAGRHLLLPLVLVAGVFHVLFAASQLDSAALLLSPQSLLLLVLCFAGLLARRRDARLGRLAIPTAMVTGLLSVTSLSPTTARALLLMEIVSWRSMTLLGASLAAGTAAVAIVFEVNEPGEDRLLRSIVRLQSVGLLVEALALALWWLLPGSIRPPVVAAPAGYDFVLGGIGAGILVPLLLTHAEGPRSMRLVAHLAVLAGSLALRHGLLVVVAG